MPPTAQLVATICLASVVGFMFVAALAHSARTRNPLFVLGGLLAAVNEPLANIVGMVFHPLIGQWRVLESRCAPATIA